MHIFCAIKRINQWFVCVIKEGEKATKKRIIGKSPKIRHTKQANHQDYKEGKLIIEKTSGTTHPLQCV